MGEQVRGLERLQQLASQGDADAADELMALARRRQDEALADFVRSVAPRYRWPGCRFLGYDDAGRARFEQLKTGLELREVAARDFVLSCTAELGAQPWSEPRHVGTFLIGASLVTQGVFWRFLGYAPAWRPEARRATAFRSGPLYGWPDHRPRLEALDRSLFAVPWTAARAFCDWAELDLPSEAQWVCAFELETGDAARGRVGMLREWCADAWHAPEPELREAGYCGERIVRGLPLGVRGHEWEDVCDEGTGFRVALSQARSCSLPLERQHALATERWRATVAKQRNDVHDLWG